jgi:hypothetical protein
MTAILLDKTNTMRLRYIFVHLASDLVAHKRLPTSAKAE